MEQILKLIGLAKKAGRMEIGEEPVGSAARAKHARVILLAEDAAASSVRRARSFANAGACLCLGIPATKEELGRAVGRTSCAMLAITDIGLAHAIVEKLAVLQPERYREASLRLEVKAQRALERRQEQARHEKNLRQGKKRGACKTSAVPSRRKEVPPGQPQDTASRSARPARPAASHASNRRPRAARQKSRWEGSLPVKKGKGSRRKEK